MSGNASDDTVRLPAGSAWGAPAVPRPAVRHSYGLEVRNPSLRAAAGLLLRSMPYALARFGVLFAAAVAGIAWLCVGLGGAGWLGLHVASVFGWAWFLLWAAGTGFLWATVLRYALHLLECGHVAVLTDLITKGAVGNGTESMFAYGRRIVTQRFGEVSLLFGLNALVRGVLATFHRTLDFAAELLPLPGLKTLSSLMNLVLRAATRYLDKVVFSYGLARTGEDPATTTREGLVYYAQNAKPILKTAIRVVILDRVLTGPALAAADGPRGRDRAAATRRRAGAGRACHGIGGRIVRRLPARRRYQAAVPDHDDGVLPQRRRRPADRGRVGRPAGRIVRQVPQPGPPGRFDVQRSARRPVVTGAT